MRLEDVTAEIRPRVPWESIDLGCALARRHLGAITKAWLFTVVPLWLVMAAILHNHPILFILCVWWLKPIYDRVPLFVVSRALFGAEPKVKEVVRAWPKLMVRRLWFSLVVGRFSPARSLSLPVAELEGLRGSAYRQRVALLERNGGEGATMATLSGMLLEAVTALGMVMLVMMMVPEAVTSRWASGVSDFFDYSDLSEIPDSFFWLMSVVYMAAITLMEPFYVSAGFALYVNSRTLTEGWDIELAFKRLGARLKKGAGPMMLLMVVVGVAFGGVRDVRAEPAGGDPAQESVQKILNHEDFKVHHKVVDVPVKKKKEKSWLSQFFEGSGIPQIMGVIGVILFYVIVVLVIAGLIYLVYKNRHVFSGIKAGGGDRSGPKTTAVMGMDVRPESLPDDIPEAARTALRDGDFQLALSYLYRGAIGWMIHRAQLPIEEGDTEGDCLNRSEHLADGGMVQYFSDLTRAWVAVAYGQKTPDDRSVLALCDRWPFRATATTKLERGAK